MVMLGLGDAIVFGSIGLIVIGAVLTWWINSRYRPERTAARRRARRGA